MSPHVARTYWRARLGSPYRVLGRRLRWRGAFIHKCVGLMLGAAAFMHVSLVNIHERGMCVRPSMFAVPVVTISSHSSPHPSLLPSLVSHVFGSFCAVVLWYAGRSSTPWGYPLGETGRVDACGTSDERHYFTPHYGFRMDGSPPTRAYPTQCVVARSALFFSGPHPYLQMPFPFYLLPFLSHSRFTTISLPLSLSPSLPLSLLPPRPSVLGRRRLRKPQAQRAQLLGR